MKAERKLTKRERIIERDSAKEAIDLMMPIAESLDKMPSDRSRLLALAFFVGRYDREAADRLYAMASKELDRDAKKLRGAR